MISFVIPAFNEEFEISSTLGAIHNAAHGAGEDYEIIVVDDASTDATAKIARDFGAQIVPISRRQIAAARNAGAQAAHGSILFFVDADTRINARHIADAISALASGLLRRRRTVGNGWGNSALGPLLHEGLLRDLFCRESRSVLTPLS